MCPPEFADLNNLKSKFLWVQIRWSFTFSLTERGETELFYGTNNSICKKIDLCLIHPGCLYRNVLYYCMQYHYCYDHLGQSRALYRLSYIAPTPTLPFSKLDSVLCSSLIFVNKNIVQHRDTVWRHICLFRSIAFLTSSSATDV